jgi:hypothetical protein
VSKATFQFLLYFVRLFSVSVTPMVVIADVTRCSGVSRSSGFKISQSKMTLTC